MYCDPPGPRQDKHIQTAYKFVRTESYIQNRTYRFVRADSYVQARTYRLVRTDPYVQTRTYGFVGTGPRVQIRMYRFAHMNANAVSEWGTLGFEPAMLDLRHGKSNQRNSLQNCDRGLGSETWRLKSGPRSWLLGLETCAPRPRR